MSNVTRRDFLSKGKVLVGASLFARAPYGFVKKRYKIRVLGTHVTLQEIIRKKAMQELGIEIEVGSRLITIDHAYTHFKVTLNVFNCTHLSGEPQPLESDEVKWVTLDEIDEYPFPKANSQIIEALKQQANRE